MTMSILIDTTVCTACRACQVACKQWHDLPAEPTTNNGGFQNPENLSYTTYKLVRMSETVIDNKLHWLFFPDQCRHCVDAPCLETAFDEQAIYRDPVTGAIIYTRQTRRLDPEEINYSCPYDIPRKGPDSILAKCDLCNDRVHNGLSPACVTACPTGAIRFGNRKKILADAAERLVTVKKKYPGAALLDPEITNVIYLVAFDPDLYSKNAVAANRHPVGISRQVALRRMMGPVARMLRI
jgi:formate dehydrogenase iron-sulfur subunit